MAAPAARGALSPCLRTANRTQCPGGVVANDFVRVVQGSGERRDRGGATEIAEHDTGVAPHALPLGPHEGRSRVAGPERRLVHGQDLHRIQPTEVVARLERVALDPLLEVLRGRDLRERGGRHADAVP